MLAHSTVSPDYLRHRCKRMAWAEIPEVWRHEFECWLDTA